MSTHEKNSSSYAKVYNPIEIGSIDGTCTEPHDNGIVRACNAKYRPNPLLTSNSEATLFVGRLEKDVTEADLEKLFSKHGSLKSVKVVRDVVTGFSKRYGFVEFHSRHNCCQARRKEHKVILKGKEILVDYQYQHSLPGWIPRRLGGGFGGFKESGQLRFGCLDRPWKRPVVTYSNRKNQSEDEIQHKADRNDRPLRVSCETTSSTRHTEDWKPSDKMSRSRSNYDDESRMKDLCRYSKRRKT